MQGRDPRYEVGLGGLRAEYAVEDRDRSDVDYSAVAGVRSEIEGLHEFMGHSLAKMEFPNEAGVRSTILRADSQPMVDIGEVDRFRVTLTADYWAGPDRPNVSAIGETTFLRTVSDSTRPVVEHLRVHEAVRDLLAVLVWQPVDFTEVMVQHDDAPALSLGGTTMGAAWRRIHSPHLRQRDRREPSPTVRFADVLSPTSFEAVGADGRLVALQSRDKLARFLDPLIALRFSSVVTPQVALMQTSIAAEALAYSRALRAGATKRAAREQSFEGRLRDLVENQPLDLAHVVGDQEAWISAAAKAYNGLKHANKPLPTPPIPTLIAGTLVGLLRAHLLLELGVSPAIAGGPCQEPELVAVEECLRAPIELAPES